MAAANLADITAMGGRATALTVGLAAPADLPVEWALDLARGIAAECDLVGASVVGGDLTAADQVVVAVTALGQVEGDPVRRSGARPGDVVALAGRQGWAAGGLAVLTRGFRSPAGAGRGLPPSGAAVRRRTGGRPRWGRPSMIDVSDGLLADVGHLAAASGVAVDVRTDAFEIAEPLRAVGAALGADPMRFVLTGGDDHALVATFPRGHGAAGRLEGRSARWPRARASPSTARRTRVRPGTPTSERPARPPAAGRSGPPRTRAAPGGAAHGCGRRPRQDAVVSGRPCRP